MSDSERIAAQANDLAARGRKGQSRRIDVDTDVPEWVAGPCVAREVFGTVVQKTRLVDTIFVAPAAFCFARRVKITSKAEHTNGRRRQRDELELIGEALTDTIDAVDVGRARVAV